MAQVISSRLGLSGASIPAHVRLEELGVDSLTFLELIIEVENQLGVWVDPDRLPADISPQSRFGELVTSVLAAAESTATAS